MEVALYVVLVLSLAVSAHAVVVRRRLRAAVARARREAPTDAETGLLNHRAFEHRLAAEFKRARRDGTSVWLTTWTVVEGDADHFGRRAADGLRFPEVGFRLAERVFCFARPNATAQQRADLSARLEHATPRNRAAVGQATWTGGVDEDPMALLHRALDEVR